MFRKTFKWLSIVAIITLALSGLAVVYGQVGTVQAANPSANLDQCANDPAPSPSTNGCATDAKEWVNGNLGASKSVDRKSVV